jgi:putative membrane protein
MNMKHSAGAGSVAVRALLPGAAGIILAIVGVVPGLTQKAFAQVEWAQNDPVQSPQNQNLPNNQPGMSNSTPGSQSAQPTSMRDSLGAPGLTGQEMADNMFVRKVAQGGLAEVKLGELAVQKGSPDVKVFGQKMIDDHTSINKDFASVADAMGVLLPKKMTKEDQAVFEKLSALSGDAFDKAYIAEMIKDHRQDLRDFRAEASVAYDTDLQAEVVKAGAVLREHMQMVSKLATEKGVPMPPRPQRPATPGQ